MTAALPIRSWTKTAPVRGAGVLQVAGPVLARAACLPGAKADIMFKLIRPTARANAGLSDARSTGNGPPARVGDILAVRGTLKPRS